MPAALASELHARAGGNPFFVEELFAARTGDRSPRRSWRGSSGSTRAALAAARRGRRARVVRAARPPRRRRRTRCAAALDAGVLVRERDGLAFRHGLIGEVVYERLLPAERAELHRAHRRAGSTTPRSARITAIAAGLRAEALAASIEAGTEAAARVRLRRGERALRARARARATTASTGSSCSRAPRRRRASAAIRSGRSRAAARRSRSRPIPPRRARLFERLGEYHFWDDEIALGCYEQALALCPGEPRLLAAKGHALMGLRRWSEARACCEAALSAGAAPRITLGVVLAFLGEAEAGEAHLRRALELVGVGRGDGPRVPAPRRAAARRAATTRARWRR